MRRVPKAAAREEALQHAVAHSRGGVAERCVLPSVATDIDEGGEIGTQLVKRSVAKRIVCGAPGEIVDGPFERSQPTLQEHELPRHGDGDAYHLEHRAQRGVDLVGQTGDELDVPQQSWLSRNGVTLVTSAVGLVSVFVALAAR